MPKRFSTKNLFIDREPTAERSGVGTFEFTDDYSIFHFGKMPDLIPGKGEAIARLAAYNCALMQRHGLLTHFRRLVGANKLEFELLRILDPQKGQERRGERCYMIPLQVVYRNYLPEGNSVARRVKAGKISLAQLGLSRMPRADEPLAEPIVEFTTKLEEIDRFVTAEEAQQISGLSNAQFAELREMVLRVAKILSAHAKSVGLLLADGKAEFGISDQGELILVDHVGTPDENRFQLDGFHVSKQVLRDYYLPTGIEQQIQQWAADGVPREKWTTPARLPKSLIAASTHLYRAFYERWTGERIYGGPSLEEVIAMLREEQFAKVA